MNKQQYKSATLWDRLMTLPQYLIPHHRLSMLMYRLTRSKVVWFKTLFIRFIVKAYNVNTAEAAESDVNQFSSFNAFFTRKLRAGVRPIAENGLVSPVDGAISQIGNIEQGRIIQAKGQDYSVLELLAGDESLATQFENGQFTTIYLSPRDYHRIHMPVTGKLQKMTYIPGKLFSVSPRTARTVPNLFARNERVVTVFDTEQGPMVLVLVGAIFVGSMETVWQGLITPPYGKAIRQWNYDDAQAISLQKGEEMGRFNMGSTVIILLPEQADKFDLALEAGQAVVMGQAMT
ncbi:MAG: phosphatidylserine decarboxylase [Piscirickettsiaceae bacterium]|nr:phosphatidylserine decarboxylase [Piscirickettsiaceae bacterium]